MTTDNGKQTMAVLFDFDYTLGDATEGIVLCANHALERMALPPCAREDIRRTVGLTLAESFAQLTGSGEERLGRQYALLFKAKADEVMTENTVLFPDAVPALEKLKGEGMKTGIVTTKYRYRIDEILAKYGTRHLVDVVVGGEDVRNAKPDPEGLLLALEKLGVPVDRALFVGDTTIDAGTAQRANVGFIAVTTGTTGREAFAAFPCRRVVGSLKELLDSIDLYN